MTGTTTTAFLSPVPLPRALASTPLGAVRASSDVRRGEPGNSTIRRPRYLVRSGRPQCVPSQAAREIIEAAQSFPSSSEASSSRQPLRISFRAPVLGRVLSSSTRATPAQRSSSSTLEIGGPSRVDVRMQSSSGGSSSNMSKGELLYLMQIKREIMRQGIAEPEELRDLNLPDIEEFDFEEDHDDLGIGKKNPKKRDIRKAEEEKDRKARLASRPGPRTQKWEEMLQKLAAFNAEHGHFDVPRRWQQDPDLGAWVKKQRTDYTKGILSETRSKKLMSLGFSFERSERKAEPAERFDDESDGGVGRRTARKPRRPEPSGSPRTRASSAPSRSGPSRPVGRPRTLRTPAPSDVDAIPLPPPLPSPRASAAPLGAPLAAPLVPEPSLSHGAWSSTIACLARSSKRMGRVNSGAASRLRAEVLALESDPLDGWSSSESEEDVASPRAPRAVRRRRQVNPALLRPPSDAEVVALGPSAEALSSLPVDEPRRPRIRTRRPARGRRALSTASSE
eukprot:tig00021795_g23517.t1